MAGLHHATIHHVIVRKFVITILTNLKLYFFVISVFPNWTLVTLTMDNVATRRDIEISQKVSRWKKPMHVKFLVKNFEKFSHWIPLLLTNMFVETVNHEKLSHTEHTHKSICCLFLEGFKFHRRKVQHNHSPTSDHPTHLPIHLATHPYNTYGSTQNQFTNKVAVFV